MFTANDHQGYRMKFRNGWTISVQWGMGNYCSNREGLSNKSETAEIAIWDCNNKWYMFEGDTVKGYCTADEVAEWMAKVVMFDSKEAE